MKKRLSSLLLLSSLSGFPLIAVAGLSIAALATIAAGVMGVAGVVVASPGLLTGAVFMGGAGLLCMTTSFCDPSTSNGVPSAAPSGSPLAAASNNVSPYSRGPLEARSGLGVCAAIKAAGGDLNIRMGGPASGGFTCADILSSGDYAALYNRDYFCADASSLAFGHTECDLPGQSFENLPSDGLKVSNPSSSSPDLDLPSVSSLPADAVEIWPGIYGSPSTNVLYDMRNPDGTSAGNAQTSLTNSDDGSSRLTIDIVGSGGTSDGKMAVDSLPDGSRVVTVTRSVPVTDAQGNPDTLKSAVVTEYDPGGSVVVSTTFGNGATDNGTQLSSGTVGVAPSSGGDGSAIGVDGSVDTGTGTGTGTGTTGTGTGSCTSGDCATESTQLANKGLLQAIKDWLTGTSNVDDPAGRSGADITGAMDGNGVFNGLLSWTVPGHQSTCPTSSFDFFGQNMVIDQHCQFINDNFSTVSFVMLAMWAVLALFIVLGA